MLLDACRLTATQARERMGEAQLTSRSLTRACLDRIAARESEVQAWAHLDPSLAMDQAEARDAASSPLLPHGPLHGVPIGIKDVIQTRDMPTQHNSRLYEGAHPGADAACVAILRAAGAVILGKTETVEFAATGRVAPTRNPHDLARTPGGSSSGSAAAVADFHAPLALGTQTGGSIIRPASYCGVYGMKTTWGLVSREGVKPFAPSLDTVGWFARSVADLRLLYDVFDPEPAPALTRPLALAGARIGLCHTAVWDQAGPATRGAMARAVQALGEAGARVEPLDLPEAFDDLIRWHGVIMKSEARASFLAEYRLHGDRLDPNLRGYVLNAEGFGRRELVQAHDIAADCRARFDDIAAPFDAILTPSVVGEAPIGLGATGSYAFNAMWSLLQVPCVNVPLPRGPEGLPVGLTLTGARFADRAVLAAAEALGALWETPLVSF